MSEDPLTSATSGGVDTMDRPVPEAPLDGAAVAVKAAGIGKGLVELHQEPSVQEFDPASLPPKSPEQGVAEKGEGTRVAVVANPEGTLVAERSEEAEPVLSQQVEDVGMPAEESQDASADISAASEPVNAPMEEATMTAWPGNEDELNNAPVNDSGDPSEVNAPVAAGSETSDLQSTAVSDDATPNNLPTTTTPSPAATSLPPMTSLLPGALPIETTGPTDTTLPPRPDNE